jgi:hypothetical protein
MEMAISADVSPRALAPGANLPRLRFLAGFFTGVFARPLEAFGLAAMLEA